MTESCDALIFLCPSGLVVEVDSVGREWRSTSSPPMTSEHWRTRSNSTTPALRRCPWTWPTLSKHSERVTCVDSFVTYVDIFVTFVEKFIIFEKKIYRCNQFFVVSNLFLKRKNFLSQVLLNLGSCCLIILKDKVDFVRTV